MPYRPPKTYVSFTGQRLSEKQTAVKDLTSPAGCGRLWGDMSASFHVVVSTDPTLYGLDDDQEDEAKECAERIRKGVLEEFDSVECSTRNIEAPVTVKPCKSNQMTRMEARIIFNWIDARWSQLSGRAI